MVWHQFATVLTQDPALHLRVRGGLRLIHHNPDDRSDLNPPGPCSLDKLADWQLVPGSALLAI